MKRLDFLKRLLVIPAIPIIAKEVQAENKQVADRRDYYSNILKKYPSGAIHESESNEKIWVNPKFNDSSKIVFRDFSESVIKHWQPTQPTEL